MFIIADSYLASVERLGFAVSKRLAPGLEVAAVESLASEAGLLLSREVCEFFAWRNGIADRTSLTLGEMWLVPGYYPLSLGEALTFVSKDYSPPGIFPLFANGGGDFWGVPISGDGSVCSEQSGVYECLVYEPPPEKSFDSIESMWKTLAMAVDSRIIFVVAETHLEIDYMAFDTLRQELNPGSRRAHA